MLKGFGSSIERQAEMSGPIKGKQKTGVLFCRKRSIEMKPAVIRACRAMTFASIA